MLKPRRSLTLAHAAKRARRPVAAELVAGGGAGRRLWLVAVLSVGALVHLLALVRLEVLDHVDAVALVDEAGVVLVVLHAQLEDAVHGLERHDSAERPSKLEGEMDSMRKKLV